MGVHDRVDKLANLPPEIRERIKAQMAKGQAEFDARFDRLAAKTFRLTENSLILGNRTASGLPDHESLFAIGRFQNQNGDVLYLRKPERDPWPSLDHMATLSAQIKSEQAAFGTLTSAEQTKIQRQFDTGERIDPRFAAYLSNQTHEALYRQFRK